MHAVGIMVPGKCDQSYSHTAEMWRKQLRASCCSDRKIG